jgi:hypothetical protein
MIIVYQGTIMYMNYDRHMKHVEHLQEYHQKAVEVWKEERQQLLDRIQASSFAEYKTQEVRVIKAQSGEKEPPKIEQL